MKTCILTFILVFTALPPSMPDEVEKMKMVEAVNAIRSRGCHCGWRFMPPVPPIQWSDHLFRSAYIQAEEMHTYQYFSHFSKDGLNIGERLEKVGYDWMVAGENLGEGQLSFDEVLSDWLKSYSHCKMLMHPRVTEMAIAKVDKYWVQHFGKPMPEKK